MSELEKKPPTTLDDLEELLYASYVQQTRLLDLVALALGKGLPMDKEVFKYIEDQHEQGNVLYAPLGVAGNPDQLELDL